MKLFNPLNILNKNQEDQEENYLAFSLTNTEIFGLVWKFQGDDVAVLGFSKKPITSQHNLVRQAAQVIDAAASKATADISKVVFGLSHYYLEDSQPSKETTKLLKNLADDLELEPQAFVSIAASINHLLKVESTASSSSVLVGVFDNFCEIHLIENNNLTRSQVARSYVDTDRIVNLVRNLKEEGKELPARVIFFGNTNLPVFKQISEINWKDLFMHEPKTSTLEDQDLAKSVAYAHAADILGYEPTQTGAVVEIPLGDTKQAETTKLEENTDDLGFIEGEDVLLAKPDEKTDTKEGEHANVIPVSDEATRDVLTPVPPPRPPIIRNPEDYAVIPPYSQVTSGPYNTNMAHTQEARYHKPGIFSKLKFPSLPKFNLSPKKLGIAIIILILLVVGSSFVAGRTLTAADVVLKVNAKTIEESFDVKVSPNSSLDIDKRIIPAEQITGKAQGNQKSVATGTKRTGTKAKGEVKVLNWDKQSAKTFAQGIQVITKDGLKFALDSEIQVASRGATTPGEAKVAATAADIGSQYNVGAGSDFSVVGFDEVFYSGIAETAFSGGEEKQVTVVAATDMQKLEADLTKSLTQKAKDDLKNQGHQIDESQVVVKVTKREFDAKEGDEASVVNLNLEIEAQVLVYKEEDLKVVLASLASQDADQNQEARPEEIEITDVDATRKGSDLTLSGDFKANLTPKLNEDDLKEKIKGKSTKDARSILKENSEIAEVLVSYKPNLPLVDNLPTNKDKITFKIEVN